MNILLINPPFLPKYSRSSRSPAVTKSGTIYYPIWLSHATGLLEKRGHVVMLLDFPAEEKTLSDYKERILSFKPVIAVFDTSTPSIESDVKCLEEVKQWFNGSLLTVLVGTHPSAMVHETFALSRSIDIIARREYDFTLCDVAEHTGSLENVHGISYRSGDAVIDNPARPFAENLDELPFVSSVYKKHLNSNNYFYAHCQNPIISIFAGRGCPNRCFYCVYPQVMFGHRYRHRSVTHFVNELEYIRNEFPEVREVLIDDDNFTADQNFVTSVCDEIVRRNINITWTCEARVELAYDVMRKMKKAGCRLLVAGFESGDQSILNQINKGTTVQQNETFVVNARKAGIRVHGCFMAGNKGETPETLERTLQFALRLPLDTVQFFPLMVYPGTAAYDWAKASNYITAAHFRDWLTSEGMHSCVVSTPSLTHDTLIEFCHTARRRFFLRPTYLMYKLTDVLTHPSEIARTFKAARIFLKHLLMTQDKTG